MVTRELGTYEWEFIGAYIEAALFTSTDNSDESGGEPLDRNYTADDIAESSRQAITKDCVAFMTANRQDLESDEALGAEQAGHDFWLTRNGHGAGFWDGDWPTAMGKRLTASAKKFGEMDMYVGDDGKLYITSSKYPGGKRRRAGGKKRGSGGKSGGAADERVAVFISDSPTPRMALLTWLDLNDIAYTVMPRSPIVGVLSILVARRYQKRTQAAARRFERAWLKQRQQQRARGLSPGGKRRSTPFAKLSRKLAARGARNPKALAAWIGRKQIGQAEMTRRAMRGRKRKHGSGAARLIAAASAFKAALRG